METLESLLRDKFGRPADLDPLWVGGLVENTARLRRRRDTRRIAAASVGAVSVVLIVVVALSSIAAPARRHEATAPDKHVPIAATIAPIPTSLARVPNVLTWAPVEHAPGEPERIVFGDAANAFGDFVLCNPVTRAGCQDHLRASMDGGLTWAAVVKTPPGFDGELPYAFDGEHLLFESFPYDSLDRLPARNPAGWVSSDAGRTWHAAARVPITHADHLPPGAQLLTELQWSGSIDGMLAINADGSLVDIVSAPAGVVPLTASPTDGSIFAESPDHHSGWYVSRDLGRTWVHASMPVSRARDIVSPLGASAGMIFADVDHPEGSGFFDPHDVIASSDAGLTWHVVTLPPLTPISRPAKQDPLNPDGLHSLDQQLSEAVTESGGLIVNDGARTWRMAPGTSTFVADDQAFPISFVEQRGLLILAFSADTRQPDPEGSIYVSFDGIGWQQMIY